MAGGRPTKLNDDLQKVIVDSIKAGAYVETAAAFAGISKDTFYNWMRRGAKAQTGRYRQFSDAVQKAQAESEMRDVASISQASRIHWQAAAWRLERKFPERWGRKEFRGTLDKEGRPTDPAPAAAPVLVVPAHVEDIEEWSKQAIKKMKSTQVPLDDPPADTS